MKRLWFIYVLVGLMAVMLGNEVIAADKPEKVRIGFLSLVNGQLISKDQKFHEQEMGVPVEWFQFDSGRDVNTAMASGSLDFGNLGLPPITIGVGGGMKYWGVFNANILGAVESLVVRPPIASVKDLVGKTVVCPFGSTTHYLLLKALNMNGVDPSKLKILDMSPSESLAAFMRKDIDAAYTWEPSLGGIVKAGGKIILTSKEMLDRGYPTWDIIAVQPEFAQKYPDFVVKFIKSELRAIEFWYSKPDQAAEIVAKQLGKISVEDGKRMMAGTELLRLDQQLSDKYMGTAKKKGATAQDIVNCGQFLVSQGRIKKEVTLEQAQNFLHPEFMEKVKEELEKKK